MLNIAMFNMNIQHSISIGRIEMKEIKSTLKLVKGTIYFSKDAPDSKSKFVPLHLTEYICISALITSKLP